MSMIDTPYRYSTYDDAEFDTAYTLRVYDWKNPKYDHDDEYDLGYLAEACAEDYYSNHDGWEHRSWTSGSDSITFYIWLDENTKVVYDVYLEFQPSFSAHKAEK